MKATVNGRVEATTERARPDSSSGAGTDVRATHRFPLHTEVEFTWTGADGTSKDGRGETRDLSQRGAYVVASSYPPAGAIVWISISLPPVIGTGKAVRMEVVGRVVRVESRRPTFSADRCGFAVSNNQVKLCAG